MGIATEARKAREKIEASTHGKVVSAWGIYWRHEERCSGDWYLMEIDGCLLIFRDHTDAYHYLHEIDRMDGAEYALSPTFTTQTTLNDLNAHIGG